METMATRASIICKRNGETVARLYHHRDGYELGVGQTLYDTFCSWYKPERIGEKELIKKLYELEIRQPGRELEPHDRDHGDTEFLYIIDLETAQIFYYTGAYWDKELQEQPRQELTRDKLNNLELKQLQRVKHYQETGERL